MESITSAVTPDRSTPFESRLEVELAGRARAGDRLAFEALLDARLEPTLRTAMAVLGDETDARDATQAIFIRAWQSLPTLRDPERFSAWFGRIVVNTCRTSLRGRRRRTVREIPVSALDGGDERFTTDPLDAPDRIAELDVLERAFERLSEAERIVVWLHYYEGRPLADIAGLIDAPVSTVKSRLFTARRALERGLEAEDR
jgi:RNA polymerase sigma-70 factor (ECF subfamily)